MKRSLLQSVLLRMLCGGGITVLLTEIVVLINTLIVMRLTGNPQAVPLVPDYAARFENPYIALIIQVLLCGLIGMSFSGCSVIFEMEKWSLIKQAVLHFILTAIVWVPVGMFCWGLGKYKNVYISVGISILITYVITWVSRIVLLRKETREINEQLIHLRNADMREDENERSN